MIVCQEEMELALWAKAQEWEEVWVEAAEIARVQAREEIVFVLLVAQRFPIKQVRPAPR